MLIGNQTAKDIFEKYINNFSKTGGTKPGFFLLSGPSDIGKASFVVEYMKNFLGDYFMSDFLHIKDMSEYTKKLHNIKVNLPDDKKKQIIEYPGGVYQDIGTREMNKWLGQTSMGPVKVLFVENIERMTHSAANAFLKTCEEPLNYKIIIATTSNLNNTLGTIISRAVLIKFNELDELMLNKFCDDKGLFADHKFRKFVFGMAMGKPGLLTRFDKIFKENDLEQKLLKVFDLLEKSDSVFDIYNLLLEFNNFGIMENIIDGWISYCVQKGYNEKSKKRLEVKKMRNANIAVENLVIYGSI